MVERTPQPTTSAMGGCDRPDALGLASALVEVWWQRWLVLSLCGIHLLTAARDCLQVPADGVGNGWPVVLRFSDFAMAVGAWGLFVAWRMFASHGHARWDRRFVARILVFAVWIMVPGLVPIALFLQGHGPVVPDPAQVTWYAVAGLEIAMLVAWGAFLANALRPGLLATAISLLYTVNLSLIGAAHEALEWLLVGLAVAVVLAAVRVRSRFESGEWRERPRVVLAFMIGFLVVLPTFFSVLNGFLTATSVVRTVKGNIGRLAAEQAKSTLRPAEQVFLELVRKIFGDQNGDVSIQRKLTVVFGLIGVCLVLSMGVVVVGFWRLQARYELVDEERLARAAQLDAIIDGAKAGLIVVRPGDDTARLARIIDELQSR